MASAVITGTAGLLQSSNCPASSFFHPARSQDLGLFSSGCAFSSNALPFILVISAQDRLRHGISSQRRWDDRISTIGAALAVGKDPKSQNGGLLNILLLDHGEEKGPEGLADRLRLGGFDKQGMSYREKFVIRCYEVGMNRTASIESVANLLQEAACNHAQSVGFSTDGFATTPSMRRRRLIWVTTRMHIEVDEYPVWGDVVEVETWCQSEGKVGTRRDWLLTNVATRKIIGRATSTWVMMNQDTRRLARITDDIREEYMIYCPDPPRWAFPEGNSCSLKKIPKLEDSVQYIRSGLMPRRGDLDMNQHVNNVTYIGWILESMPQDVIDTHQLHRITLDYRRECKYDDVVQSLASLEPIHHINGVENLCATAISNNGVMVNGTSVSHSSKTKTRLDCMEFLHMLRLDESEIEINRGRTEWKLKAVRQLSTS